MPIYNKPFLGQDKNPLIKSVFVRTWNDDIPIPPIGTEFIVTENNILITTENGIDLITE